MSTDSRPTVAGKPCWLGTRWALPVLIFEPVFVPVLTLHGYRSGSWRVGVYIQQGDNSFRWEQIEIYEDLVSRLLWSWQQNPEQTLIDWWSCQPPTQAAEIKGETATRVLAQDLGL
jgi:hypothetical protein